MDFPFEKLDWKKESGEIKFRFPDVSDNMPLSEVRKLSRNPKILKILLYIYYNIW